MMWGDHGYGWWGFGWIPMIFFWIVLILIVVALAKWIFDGWPRYDRRVEKSALDILKERYARGEIEREEFEQKKRDLGG